MRIKITAPAVIDLCEIEEYISKENINAAERLINRLQARCVSLVDNPNIGRKRDHIKAGLRTLTEANNYVICYRIKHTTIEILRILNAVRDIEKIML